VLPFSKRKHIKRLITLLLVLSCYGRSSAQEVLHFAELLTEKNGLNDVVINDLITDNEGLLWIGTENGLNRLINGKYELFHEFSRINQTAGHSTTYLFVDSKSRLWVGDRLKGISVLNPKTGKSHLIRNAGPNSVFEGKEVLEIKEAQDSSIWALVFPNIFLHFSPDLDLINSYKFTSNSSLAEVSQVKTFDLLSNHQLIFPTISNGVFTLDGNTGKISHEEWLSKFYPEAGYFPTICKVAEGKYFAAIDKSHVLIDYDSKQIRLLANTGINPYTRTSCQIRDGYFWLVNFPIVRQYSIEGELIKDYTIQLPREFSYLQFNYKKSWIDESSIIWIGSDQGILKVDLKKQAFKVCNTSTKQDNRHLSGNYIRYLKTNKSGKLIISYVGETSYDELEVNRSAANNITFSAQSYSYPELQTPQHIATGIRVNAIHESEKWGVFSSSYSGLFLRKKGKNYSERITLKSETYKNLDNSIWAFHPIDEDHFILATRQFGLGYFDYPNKSIGIAEVQVTNAKWNKSAYIWDLFTDSQKRTWVLSSNGLFLVLSIDKNKISLRKILELHDYSIWSMTETKDHEFWVGSIEQGLFNLDKDGNFLKNLNYQNNLKSMTVCSVIMDDNDNLWVSAPNGLYTIDCKTKNIIRHFSHRDGLISEGFNYRTATKDQFGNLYFGTKNGLIYFNPSRLLDTIKDRNYSSNILIHAINKSELFEKIGISTTIQLGPEKRNLFIEPTLTDYTQPIENQYVYTLEGYDNEWYTQKSATPSIRYSNLPPGDYQLKIHGINASGNETKNEISIPITVKPFFYESSWFLALILIFSISLISWIVAIQIRANKNQRRMLESQMDSLRAQMNPHFFFNALNSIQDFIFHKDREKAADFMSGFAKLLRSILQASGRKYISLNDEEALLKQYLNLEALRFEGLLEWSIDIDPSISKSSTYIPTMLIQPIIENAIKHGLAPLKKDMILQIRFYRFNQFLACEVQDNGVGRAAAAKMNAHESKGLWLIEKRLRLLNMNIGVLKPLVIEDLVDENQQAKGTRVRLILNTIS